jgi:broad-specificity NMP kinase
VGANRFGFAGNPAVLRLINGDNQLRLLLKTNGLLGGLMSISLQALCRSIVPNKTALLLGAGASVPSGAPSGKQLAHTLWKVVAQGQPMSDDLIESASMLERNYGRRSLVEAVASTLGKLKPTGGMLGLPRFGWHSIFSTNFDRLVELSFKACAQPINTIRSNFDLSSKENRVGTSLYKIHGCVSQDVAFGDKAAMILTEQDYEDYGKYRQSMFSLLESFLLTGDVLIVGQSLRDSHLNDLIKRVLSYKQQGADGEVYILVYDRDDLRAQLHEDKGAKIAFGGIDDFVHAMAEEGEESGGPMPGADAGCLSLSLVSTVIEIPHSQQAEPNVKRMFNGGAASYADIRSGVTFARAQLSVLLDYIESDTGLAIALTGAGGMGKTTFSRQIASALVEKGYQGYEHRDDFTFQSQPWIALDNELRSHNKSAVLVVDECTRSLRQINLLVEYLASQERPNLKLVLTANSAQWAPRLKSPKLFSRGKVVQIAKLVDAEIYSLVNLVQNNRTIADLVQSEFKTLSRNTQFTRLRSRCSADMFVCLKNIFANDSLDRILLKEYDDLDEGAQEHYRHIAALESVGMRVHRQLIMRMLGLPADQVTTILASLAGIVDEFPIRERDGVYGWATRHLVIARKITEYKFSSVVDLEQLFERIIDNINPAVATELQSVRDICDTEFGIGRLSDKGVRLDLYRRLIEIAPGERIPWHRLIRELMNSEALEDAEYAIRDAAEAVGEDAPIDRFKVRLLVLRAEQTSGISRTDRLALLRKAFDLAERNINRHRLDKFSYRVLCDVAVNLVERGEPVSLLDQALVAMRAAASDILDPEMDRDLRYYEDARARFG